MRTGAYMMHEKKASRHALYKYSASGSENHVFDTDPPMDRKLPSAGLEDFGNDGGTSPAELSLILRLPSQKTQKRPLRKKNATHTFPHKPPNTMFPEHATMRKKRSHITLIVATPLIMLLSPEWKQLSIVWEHRSGSSCCTL